MSEIVLHGYQEDLKREIYGIWNSGLKNVLATLDTGAGKSIIVSDIVLDGARLGMRQSIIAHRNELVTQMSCHVANRGIPHRIIGARSTVVQASRQHRILFGKSFVNPTAHTAVVGVDTLVARKDDMAEWARQNDRWIVDECFTAGTKIKTQCGSENIENIKTGDSVLCFDEKTDTFHLRQVKRLFKNPIHDNMVRLTTSSHHVVKSTKDHPYWTKRGWVVACELKKTDRLLNVEMQLLSELDTSDKRKSKVQMQKNRKDISYEKMWHVFKTKTIPQERESSHHSGLYDLQSTDHSYRILHQEEMVGRREGVLQSKMFQNIPIYHSVQNCKDYKQKICIEKNEIEQSNVQRGNPKESFSISEEDETFPTNQRWKCSTNAVTGTQTNRDFKFLGLCPPIRNKNENTSRFRLSYMLQTGHGSSYVHARNRSGRSIPQGTSSTGSGSEKRFISEWVGLESIEVYKPRNTDRNEDSFVYNIEVDEFHTYVANDIVVHNCHHVLRENKWGKAVEMFSNAQGLGVTATACRADGKGLGRDFDGVFDEITSGPDMRFLVANGFLADYEMVCPRSDLEVEDKTVSASGDWSNKTLRKAVKKSHIVGDVVENYCKYALGRKAIVFSTDVETAGETAKKFTDMGIRAVALSGKTPTAVREKYINEYKTGDLMVLINVDLFDEGFDVPACDVIIMARPTASLGKYRQMIGRALRFLIGKTALIIDMVSNVVRHGLPDKHVIWSLGRRDKRGSSTPDPDEIPLTVCTNCAKPFEKFRTACTWCHHVKPLPEPASRTLEMIEGDLILLDKEALEKMRQATIPETPASIAERVGHAAGSFAAKGAANRQLEKVEEHEGLVGVINQWAGIERAKGFTDSEIHRKFYLTLRVDVLTACDASKTRLEMETLRHKIERWYTK